MYSLESAGQCAYVTERDKRAVRYFECSFDCGHDVSRVENLSHVPKPRLSPDCAYSVTLKRNFQNVRYVTHDLTHKIDCKTMPVTSIT